MRASSQLSTCRLSSLAVLIRLKCDRDVTDPLSTLQGHTDAGGDLHFYDAVIKLPGFTISTDAFHIQHGKLHLSPIRLTDKEGHPLYTYTPEQ